MLIWFARRAALVCAPPLMDFMSTSSPFSLKIPFSNAYQSTQLSAVMLLYPAMTFVQHGRFVAAAAVGAVVAAAWLDAGADVAAGAPPHAAARTAVTVPRTVSLSRMCPSRLALDLWSPALEPVLDPLQQPCEEHARARDEDDAREHLGHLERDACVGDELAHAVHRGDVLGDDHACQGMAHTEAKSREDEGDRTRKHDAAKDERLGRAERSRDADERDVGVPHAGHRVDDDREHGTEEDHRDLRLPIDAEPDDEDGDEHDAGCAVEEVHEGIEGVLEARVPAHEDPDDQADDDRAAVADRELLSARREIQPDLAARIGEERHECPTDRDRTGQEQGEHLRAIGGLPGEEYAEDADGPDQRGLVPLPAPRLHDRTPRARPRRFPAGHRQGDRVHFLDAHPGIPARSRSGLTVSSSSMLSQIWSS